MAKKVLALVGMCGAGKSVVTDYFKAKSFHCVYFGKSTLDEIARRGLELNEKNEKLVREDLRKKYGMAAYATINLPEIKDALSHGNVVIDGLYSWSEYKILRDNFADDMRVLNIFTSKKLRYERLARRKVRPLTFADSESRDYSEIENLEKGGPIAIADYTVVNDGDINNLHEQLNKIRL
jgi:dephospho-CoA kinase